MISRNFFFAFFFFICSEFCHTLKWNSHGFTCVPHPDPPSHLPLHPLPLGLPNAPGPSACLMHPTWAGILYIEILSLFFYKRHYHTFFFVICLLTSPFVFLPYKDFFKLIKIIHLLWNVDFLVPCFLLIFHDFIFYICSLYCF